MRSDHFGSGDHGHGCESNSPLLDNRLIEGERAGKACRSLRFALFVFPPLGYLRVLSLSDPCFVLICVFCPCPCQACVLIPAYCPFCLFALARLRDLEWKSTMRSAFGGLHKFLALRDRTAAQWIRSTMPLDLPLGLLDCGNAGGSLCLVQRMLHCNPQVPCPEGPRRSAVDQVHNALVHSKRWTLFRQLTTPCRKSLGSQGSFSKKEGVEIFASDIFMTITCYKLHKR